MLIINYSTCVCFCYITQVRISSCQQSSTGCYKCHCYTERIPLPNYDLPKPDDLPQLLAPPPTPAHQVRQKNKH